MSPTLSLDLRRGRDDLDARLRAIRGRPLNYDPAHAGGDGWHRDDYRQPLPPEAPGEPAPGGSWRVASALSRRYAFSDPSLVEAHFDPDEPIVLAGFRVLGRHKQAEFGRRACDRMATLTAAAVAAAAEAAPAP
jgi:hypothetical protein